MAGHSIYTVYNVLYWFSKIFGMAPYTTAPKIGYTNTYTMNRAGFCNLGIIVMVVAVMVYSFVELIIVRHQNHYYTKINTIACVLLTFRLISAITTMFAFYFTQEDCISAFEKLFSFDEKRQLFGKLKYTTSRNVAIFLILIVLSLVVGMEVVYHEVMEEQVTIIILDTFSNGLQLLVHLVALVYFELYVGILIDNFRFIKTTAENLNNEYLSTKDSQKMIHVIKTVSNMYDDLCKGAALINSVFSFPIFSLISLNFMEILLGVYLLSDVKTRNFNSIYWTAFYTIELICILIPPGTVEGQAHEISQYLAEAELEANEKVLNERNHFLLRTLHQSVEFTACGCFPISTSAIIGQFGISISFLMFMFQIIK